MKILFWDVETSPLVVATWELFGELNIGHESIIQDWQLNCVAWKWNGRGVESLVRGRDDEVLVTRLHRVLSDADILVAHNGDAFDLKKFNARALHWSLNPLPPIRTVDTLKVARKYFRLTSNRLDYLGAYLGVGRKVHTDKGLWMDVLHNKEGALEKMEAYCRGDVVLLEKVYDKLAPYMLNHPGVGSDCRKCGGREFQSRGAYITAAGKRRARYQCKGCGKWKVETKEVA